MGNTLQPGVRVERRGKPRIYRSFPVKVRGVDVNGEEFEVETSLDNISSTGLYLRLAQEVGQNVKLKVDVSLSTVQMGEIRMTKTKVAVEGVVLRAEQLPNGMFGVGVAITGRRYMS